MLVGNLPTFTAVTAIGLQIVWLFEGRPGGGSEIGAGDATPGSGEAAAAAAADDKLALSPG